MLKYGDISLINNGNSKSLVPRNLTYRQKELFKSNINDSEILNIINTNTIENINTNNIVSDNANINITNSSILYVDLINKKTSTNNQIIINNKLQIINKDLSFNYLLSNDSIFKGNSLNIEIPNIKIKGYIIDTSANINLLNGVPNITFTTGKELIIKDTTTYIGFLNNNIKFYKPLDLSPNGIIKFGSNLQINNDSFNVITINSTTIDTIANINLLNNTPEIKFKDRLRLYSTTYLDNASNAILVYNTSFNDYEKKYLIKVTIDFNNTSRPVYFLNIMNNPFNILTFTGKIVSISQSSITNSFSSHIIFQGYSRIINGTNIVYFTTNILFSSYPINWTIMNMRIENNNLVMEILDNNPTIITNWIISLESIFI
jgi:hypothetical protein